MEEKIEVLGIRMDCFSAKEAMLCAMQFLETDSVDTIEIMTMDTLMNCRDDEEWTARISELKTVLPGEAEILEAADIHDAAKLRETDSGVFLRMFMKYLQKNRKRIYFLAETEEELEQTESAVRRYNRGICISGHALISGESGREEEVINDINGTETDCVLSVLSSPYQETFIASYRTLLNAKVWFGCGPMLARSYDDRRVFQKIRHFFRKTTFRRQVGRQQKEK